MTTETVAEFESSLGGVGVDLTRTDSEGFHEALTETIREPAVRTRRGTARS